MKEKTDIKKPVYSLLPSDLDGVDLLAELALDMRWSWNHAADEVWRLLDPALWDLTHKPWVVLQTVSRDLITKWINFIRQSEVRPHVIFLSDYDMLLTERLVEGVDVWINTPRRPWEASGTSGMKVLVNGGINLSELDGWWAEAYTPEVVWALGDGKEHGDDPAWDAIEAGALYDMLERQVVLEFYNRGNNSIPGKWIERIRKSMSQLTPRFSANRTVREYTEKYYLPLAKTYKARAADKGKTGRQIVEWINALPQKWSTLQFGEVKVKTDSAELATMGLKIKIEKEI